jgi:membrane fusion protein, multidrug efflux system
LTDPTMSKAPDAEPPRGAPARRAKVPILIGAIVAVVLVAGGIMMWRADLRTNKVSLSSRPKPVTVVAAKQSAFRPSRTYVGTLEPWVQASVGPQLVSAYVDTVLVRPGAHVKRGEILATLDCRNASAAQKAVASQARAIDATQQALAHEASRTRGLLDGGFVSPNEAEQKTAQSAAQLANLEATKAKLAESALEVNDCVLRAPFDGEISTRSIDPGAFVRPGMAILDVVDRSTIRMTADAPEIDFAVVAPDTKIGVHVFATNKDFIATITRRAPAADPTTRTVHFEIDIADPIREIPVGTTGVVHVDVGEPEPATEIPLYAATLRGSRAALFVVEGDMAHSKTLAVKGEAGGSVYVDTALAPGTPVVTEGRALLEDGDRVAAREAEGPPPAAQSVPAPAVKSGAGAPPASFAERATRAEKQP